MKGKIIKPEKKKQRNWISPLILCILGIVLVTNSNSFITLILQIIGAIIAIFGVFRLLEYFKIKNQFKTDDNMALMAGILSLTVGLLTILLAGVIEIGLRYLLGFFLLLNGINKIIFSFELKEHHKTLFMTNMIEATGIILLGLYTIFFQNAALVIIGVFLIISSIIDVISLLNTK